MKSVEDELFLPTIRSFLTNVAQDACYVVTLVSGNGWVMGLVGSRHPVTDTGVHVNDDKYRYICVQR